MNGNPFDEMRRAVQESKEIMRAADVVAGDAARLIVGRLRHCSSGTLEQLKRELRDFNMQTGQWKK